MMEGVTVGRGCLEDLVNFVNSWRVEKGSGGCELGVLV